jgi:hypothetical protein
MNLNGLSFCARYAFPPNSLSLCGPENKKSELKYYSSNLYTDNGLSEILSHFSTLFPYLKLIAGENNIKDPFDKRVVEAYWIGNILLNKIQSSELANHFAEGLDLKRMLNKKKFNNLNSLITLGFLPHHSSHVLNVYIRTGHIHIPHVIETIDACIINCGNVFRKSKNSLFIKTQKIEINHGKLVFKKNIIRELIPANNKDKIFNKIKPGDLISYHWGTICDKLTQNQFRNLSYYTQLSLDLANKNRNYDS